MKLLFPHPSQKFFFPPASLKGLPADVQREAFRNVCEKSPSVKKSYQRMCITSSVLIIASFLLMCMGQIFFGWGLWSLLVFLSFKIVEETLYRIFLVPKFEQELKNYPKLLTLR